jgi:putative methionine-R-sulfoxide reductase with GAF domain
LRRQKSFVVLINVIERSETILFLDGFMEIEIQKLSSLLNVTEYADVETSIDELMEKACQIMKQSLSKSRKGTGQWTWSVFSVKNITIEQKAVGGTHATLRIAIPKREAKSGMIGIVIRPDEPHILYEADTEALPADKFLRILNNTKSAVVARIERNNDIVGVVNIESDSLDDFDTVALSDILEYISNIISQILFIDDYRSILQRNNAMFSGALAVIEAPDKGSLQVFFKHITDMFCFEFRLEAAALFISLGDVRFLLAAHSYLDSYSSRLQDMGAVLTCNDTLLARALSTNFNAPISKQNINLSELIGRDNVGDDDRPINFARLYKFDIHTDYKYIFVAISNNQFNPPDITNTKRYSRLIESFTRAYLELERKRMKKQEAVLAGELYWLAIMSDTHSNFLEAAAEKLNLILNAKACYILLVRATSVDDDSVEPKSKYLLVSTIGSAHAENTLDYSDIINELNSATHKKNDTKEPTHYKKNFVIPGSARNTKVDILLESFESSAETSSDIQIVVCLADSNQLSDQTYKNIFGIGINNSLLTIIHEIRGCMKLINDSIKNLDTKSGFEIIHKNASKIQSSSTFDDLARILHSMYGKTYQTGDDETLSSAVQMLNGSYFSIFVLEDSGNIRMSNVSQDRAKLPPFPPEFVKGSGLTGQVIELEKNGEIFVPRVETTVGADLGCKSYWNKVLSTQFRYFYGKRMEFDNTVGALIIIGARTPYFQEQVFENTIKSLFGVLSDIINVSGIRLSSTNYYQPNLTRQIIREHGDKEKNVFLMIPFDDKDKYKNIREKIREILKSHGYHLLVADEKHYSEHLNENLVAYMDACKYGIAVFDSDIINPNIAYELGYLYKSFAKCLILKDKQAAITKADFIPRLYEGVNFDKLDTVSPKVEKWIKGLKATTS